MIFVMIFFQLNCAPDLPPGNKWTAPPPSETPSKKSEALEVRFRLPMARMLKRGKTPFKHELSATSCKYFVVSCLIFILVSSSLRE